MLSERPNHWTTAPHYERFHCNGNLEAKIFSLHRNYSKISTPTKNMQMVLIYYIYVVKYESDMLYLHLQFPACHISGQAMRYSSHP